MSDWRNQIVFTAIAVAESVILFTIIAVISAGLSLDYPPLHWGMVLLLYLTGMVTSWIVGGLRGSLVTIALIYGTAGLAMIYVAVATTRLGDGFNLDLAWVYHLFNRDLTGESVASLVIALIVSLVIWRRTSTIIRDDSDAPDHLKRIFKRGLVVLAVGLIVDEFVSEPIGLAQLLIPYFIATLGGMAVARLPNDSPVAGKWMRIIVAALGLFLGTGLVAGFFGGRYGYAGLNALWVLWGWTVDAILFVLRYPLLAIGWVIAKIIEFLQSFFGSEPPEQEQEQGEGQRPEFPEREATEAADSAWVEAVLDILQWPLTFLLLFVVLIVVALAYRRIIRRLNRDDGIERETIRDEVEEVTYLDLLKGLLPDWMTRRGTPRHLWNYPDDPGIKEVFILYFETLEMALERGWEFNSRLTPSERQPELATFLDGAPIADITSRFNAACYGNVPTEVSRVEDLRSRLTRSVEILDERRERAESESS